jgi:hypothetical protein
MYSSFEARMRTDTSQHKYRKLEICDIQNPVEGLLSVRIDRLVASQNGSAGSVGQTTQLVQQIDVSRIWFREAIYAIFRMHPDDPKYSLGNTWASGQLNFTFSVERFDKERIEVTMSAQYRVGQDTDLYDFMRNVLWMINDPRILVYPTGWVGFRRKN